MTTSDKATVLAAVVFATIVITDFILFVLHS